MSWTNHPGRDLFVLGGGGAKGAFEWGVLRILLGEEGILPDEVWGTSVGSLTGYCAACHDLDLLNRIFSDVDKPSKILALKWLGLGFYISDAIYSMKPMLKNYVWPNAKVKDIKVPYHPVFVSLQRAGDNLRAPNAQNFETDEELWAAMHGSAAIPGLFSPAYWEDEILVDGGVLEVIPSKWALSNAKPGDRVWIIGCRGSDDINSWSSNGKKSSGVDVLMRSEDLSVAERILHDIDLDAVELARQRGVKVYIILPMKRFGGVKDFYSENMKMWRLHGERIAQNVMELLK